MPAWDGGEQDRKLLSTTAPPGPLWVVSDAGRPGVIARAGVLPHGEAEHFAGLMTLEMGHRIAEAHEEVEAFVNKELVRFLAGGAPV